MRNQIANSTLNQILRKRHEIRDKVREEMQKLCNGWGVWLETVEITEVLISSNNLFKDMQAEYREKVHQEAMLIKMKIDSQLR